MDTHPDSTLLQQDISGHRYGVLPMNQSSSRPGLKRTRLGSIQQEHESGQVWVSGRVQAVRSLGRRLCFLKLRQDGITVQCVVELDEETGSPGMVKFARAITEESIVLVRGIVARTEKAINYCSLQTLEIRVKQLFVTSAAMKRMPFSIEDASLSQSEIECQPKSRVNLMTRLENRVLDLRTEATRSILCIKAGTVQLLREFLQSKGFLEVHTPKITTLATQGALKGFQVDYFGVDARLVQSPRLYHAMACNGDFDRIFEFGSVFQKHMATTHRHLSEFISLDMEMVIEESYGEVVDTIDELLIRLFKGLEANYKVAINAVHQQHPTEPLEFLPRTLRIDHKDAVAMLHADGTDVFDSQLSVMDRRQLGKLVKVAFKTDVFMVDRFPLDGRPLETMPDSKDPTYSYSSDIFVRGEKIMSVSQRIHDPVMLKERAKVHGVGAEVTTSYLEACPVGGQPHGGASVGLERLLMAYLGLQNIRSASLWPRDSKGMF